MFLFLQAYLEGEQIALRVAGEFNIILARAYLNIGIYYEQAHIYENAYNYFYKWHKVCLEVYGLEHPRSVRSITTLNEPYYRRIARSKGIAIPTENK